jgi:hypothetical protein
VLVEQGLWPVVVAVAAVFVPAILGLYYFAEQRRRERCTVTKALRSEIDRLKGVLERRLHWLDKPLSRDLPLLPFDTTLYDNHLDKIGMLDSAFAKYVVEFYGTLHFVNKMHKARQEYYAVEGGRTRFFHTYEKNIHKAINLSLELGSRRR